MSSLRFTRPVAVTAMLTCAVMATGCGEGASKREPESAAAIWRHAIDAMRSAKSVHYVGETSDGARVDVRIEGGAASGTLATRDVRLTFLRVGESSFLRADAASLARFGLDADGRLRAAGRWITVPPDQITSLDGFSISDIVAQAGAISLKGAAVADDGKNIILKKADGTRLVIAATGKAYPREVSFPRPNGGRLRFIDYDRSFDIRPPAHAIDGRTLTE